MQQMYVDKLKKWCPALLLAGLLALVLLYPLRAAAAENNPDAADGGAAEIGTVDGSHNNQSTGPLISGDPYVGWYSDAWEVTLYIGKTQAEQPYKGSYLLLGNETLMAAKKVYENESNGQEKRKAFIYGI